MEKHKNLAYLYNKPRTIYWRVIAPENAQLSVLQDHDLIFDDYDLKIRKMNYNDIQRTRYDGI